MNRTDMWSFNIEIALSMRWAQSGDLRNQQQWWQGQGCTRFLTVITSLTYALTRLLSRDRFLSCYWSYIGLHSSLNISPHSVNDDVKVFFQKAFTDRWFSMLTWIPTPLEWVPGRLYKIHWMTQSDFYLTSHRYEQCWELPLPDEITVK